MSRLRIKKPSIERRPMPPEARFADSLGVKPRSFQVREAVMVKEVPPAFPEDATEKYSSGADTGT